MNKPFDSIMKDLLDAHAADWVRWLLPAAAGAPVEPLDTDISGVQLTADKVFQLGTGGLLHLEVQSSRDTTLAERLVVYNVLLQHRHAQPVTSVAILLRPEAQASNLTGTLTRSAFGADYLRFQYRMVRLWQEPAAPLLASGPGVAPLAIITDDAARDMPAMAEQLKTIILEQPTIGGQKQLLNAVHLLSGLRYDDGITRTLFSGVMDMIDWNDSSTYRAILREGETKGEAKVKPWARPSAKLAARSWPAARISSTCCRNGSAWCRRTWTARSTPSTTRRNCVAFSARPAPSLRSTS